MTQDITSLIEKLEGAEGPSQELSARVIHSVRVPDGSVEQSKINSRWCVYDKNGRLLENSSRNGWWRESGWEVTESLDAALALAERLLPGVWWIAGRGKLRASEAEYGAQLMFGEEPIGQGEGATAGLALCAAILRAQSEAR